MTTVIMAGGKGTRIASINSDVPKPMITICGKPILEYQIECLRRQNCTDIILIIGYLGDVIKEYFGDGSRLGVNISYIIEDEPLGTAGALFYLNGRIYDDFLLLNGDLIFDIDITRLVDFHRAHGGIATLLTHPNDHPYDSGIIVADELNRVTAWLHKEDKRLWYKNRVNSGIHVISPHMLKLFSAPKKTDLDRDILKPLAAQGRVFVYDSPEYVKDMGTPERYDAVSRDITSGRVSAKNLQKKQRAVFFDRDGTLNKYVGFLRDIDELELLPGAADMVRQANQNGYLAIVVTNQPVIARGDVTWLQLREIHNKLETLLGEQGAFLDDIFICPHHPDKGFVGELPEYKISCDCRKPKPGLIFDAAEKYHIDLSQSVMVGDRESDMEAGRAAGCGRLLLVDDDVRRLRFDLQSMI